MRDKLGLLAQINLKQMKLLQLRLLQRLSEIGLQIGTMWRVEIFVVPVHCKVEIKPIYVLLNI